MAVNDVFWLAAAAINMAVIWWTIPRQQIWYRRAAVLLWLCSGFLAFYAYGWLALTLQILCMVMTATAWQQKSVWLLGRPFDR